MGQGYSLTTLSAGSAGIDVPEMSDLAYDKSLGNARFMKCIRAKHRDGLVIVKVVMKPYATLDLHRYIRGIIVERKGLVNIPNALGYHRIVETSTNGYLVRQHIHSSLYDRLSTRPFLEEIEKKWLAFQLLCAVRDCHAINIYHGDIKSTNVLVTSWNWLYLTDFSASFKPTYLPEDNPADFSFFFDTSGKRTCYLAPERFLGPGEEATGKPPINWAMDIFSVGCVLAELFLETATFTLEQLFKYRLNKDNDPENTILSRIGDKDVREMIAHMIQVDPQNRYSASDCLNVYKGKVFPEYFYSFLHDYMNLITDPTSGQRELTTTGKNLGEADERIERVYNDFDKISFALGHTPQPKTDLPRQLDSDNQLFPLQVDVASSRHEASAVAKPSDDGTLIFLNIVLASMRNTARASARVKACELTLAFAERLTDEAKLDRIVPYLIAMLKDKSDGVKVAALRTVTQILALVTVVSPTNTYVFPDYILFYIGDLVPPKGRSSVWVRSTYAMCLGTLASTAARFLDMKQALLSGGSIPISDPEAEEGTISHSMYQNLFDVAREELVELFETHTKALLTDSDASVRRALLPSVGRLCVFFGSQRANDVILSHLNTYLNDRDWQLKVAFFETIVGVATYVGTAGLKEFILPLMVQALTDPEEAVVESAIRSFSSLAQLGLFQKSTLWELLDIVSRFTMHPNQWIREAAAQFISVTGTFASMADRHSIIVPLVKIYLKVLPVELAELTLLDSLKPPLSRIVMDLSSTWATKSDKTVFWKDLQKHRVFSPGSENNVQLTSPTNAKVPTFTKMKKSDEDEAWIQRLRNAGLTQDDDFKLLALQEYIWRSTHRKIRDDPSSKPSKFTNIVRLKDLDVNLQNVFFDNDLAAKQADDFDRELANNPRTIAEAIQEATDNPTNSRGKNQVPSIDTTRSKPRDIPGGSNTPLSPSEQDLLSPTARLQLNQSKQPSSVDSKRSQLVPDQHIQRKGSVMNLMKDAGGKASAEISTDTTNAFGRVERAPSRQESLRKPGSPSVPASERRIEVAKRKMTPVHSYTGGDPSILSLLDSLYIDSYPVGLLEFGQIVTPAKGEPVKRAGTLTPGVWRPEGVLVAMLSEHTAAINRVVAAPDHRFFITASDDGTVKLWDASRLERNVTHRGRRTHHHGPKVRVTSICFVENTYCFVSTGSDGSVHIVKVESYEKTNMTEYSRLAIIRDYRLPEGEFAVWSHHHQVESASILILATNKSRVIGIELRTMEKVWEMQNPLHHGTPTCFCVDKRNHWLLLGTANGVLDLWDLRFKLRVKSWGFPSGLPIHRIHQPMMRGSKRYRVTVCGGTPGDIVTIDLERAAIKEVYRTSVSTTRDAALKNLSPVPTLIDLDDDQNRPGGMLSRFATPSPMEATAPTTDRSVRAVIVGARAHDGSTTDSKHTFILSAGPDWKIRFWDPQRPDWCAVVHGLDVDEGRPTYAAQAISDALVISEKVAPASDVGAASPSGTPSKKGKGKGGAIVSLQQQNMLRGHKDMITDLALLEAPYGMVVSVDRTGVAYVYS